MADFDFHVGNKGDYIGEQTRRLGSTIIQARERKGWSQNQLAATAGVSRDTIQSAESGLHIGMTMQILYSIAWALELQPLELFGYVNTRPRISNEEYTVVLAIRKAYGQS
jgi:DNA-binding XRE family transcriptional regulator